MGPPSNPSSCSSSDTASEPGNLLQDDGWQDIESDTEVLQIRSLLDDKVFGDLQSMLDHCKANHNFDFIALQRKFGLDFYETIKFVNFIRSSVSQSGSVPEITAKAQFQDDKFLQSFLEDDSVLFSIGELDDATEPTDTEGVVNNTSKTTEVEAELQRLRLEYDEYRSTVARALDERWAAKDNKAEVCQNEESLTGGPSKSSQAKIDSTYFDSYSYNEIHETMLKDTVRTDAYRDFIYENKHIFAGKTVLDVGCGTGILSMLCAKAGATKVIAVDNSAIIQKARQNIAVNGLQDKIECIQGKIEEVILPVDKVDIIVSEWMGYCLTFEAMLDSVIWARDKYLKPDGLMVPSHCTLVAAPICDSDYITDSVDFWLDVYGFDMTAMQEKMHDDVLVRQLQPEAIIGSGLPFYTLPLHTITVDELTFVKPFSHTFTQDSSRLDGFAIWFDTFFLPSRTLSLAPDASATAFKSPAPGSIAFTTGPFGKQTHWMSGVMMIEDQKKIAPKEGQTISGTIQYDRAKTNGRGLDITFEWSEAGKDQVRKQSWTLD